MTRKPRAPRWRAPALSAGAVLALAGVLILLASAMAPSPGLGAAVITSTPPPRPATHGGTQSIGEGLVGSVESAALDHPVDGVAFTMSVPALGYSATVGEGVDGAALERGPGHYPTTAWPGRAGTVGIAAHNVYWWNFDQLKPGDRVEIQTRSGRIAYTITSTRVTDPDDRTVLVNTTEHRIALTTCYPLWAGAFATRRLVFIGRQVPSNSG